MANVSQKRKNLVQQALKAEDAVARKSFDSKERTSTLLQILTILSAAIPSICGIYLTYAFNAYIIDKDKKDEIARNRQSCSSLTTQLLAIQALPEAKERDALILAVGLQIRKDCNAAGLDFPIAANSVLIKLDKSGDPEAARIAKVIPKLRTQEQFQSAETGLLNFKKHIENPSPNELRKDLGSEEFRADF